MSSAFKCDRCGGFFEEDCSDYTVYNNGKPYDGRVDLCPQCKRALEIFLMEFKSKEEINNE